MLSSAANRKMNSKQVSQEETNFQEFFESNTLVLKENPVSTKTAAKVYEKLSINSK